jgi:hypothetical protein
MSTFDEFIESTLLFTSGFSASQEQVTSLVNPMTTGDTALTVDDASVIPPTGLIEIGSELMWVKSVDTDTDIVTLAPFGRGYRGTVAAVHSVGDRVTAAPVVPRAAVERAVNDTIRGVYPTVFGVGTTEFTFNAAVDTYSLPAGAETVLGVWADTVGPTQEWMPVRRWTVNQSASPTDFATGNSISLFDPIVPGRTVRVVYTQQPAALTAGDNFTDSGLREAAEDLIRFGTASRLVPWFEVASAPGVAAEPNYTAAMGQRNGASATARYFTQMYQLRLQEEAGALQSLYPVRSHYTR